jgi:hypothetical protein
MKRTVFLSLLFVCAAVLLSAGLSADSSRAADGPKIAVAYSGSVLGYLEPCG